MSAAADEVTTTTESPATEPERLAVAFTHLVRACGIGVSGSAALDYARALCAVGLEGRTSVYWAGRAVFVHAPEDVDAYDAAFTVFWDTATHGSDPDPPGAPDGAAPDVPDGEGGPDGEPPDEANSSMQRDGVDLAHDEDSEDPDAPGVPGLRYSASETLSEKDFARCTPEELEEAYRVIATLRWSGPRRRTRRRVPSRRRRGDPDLRSTVREAMRTGGEPVRRRWSVPVERPRRVVFVCDVSGSMAPYARVLLRFLHVAVVGGRSVEAFTIGTRLTRVTPALGARDPDAAIAAATRAVPDFSGGTRLGEAMDELNRRYASRGVTRGAWVVVLSDGWDCGDSTLLGAAMERLAHVSHRIVWVNPLIATPGYEPVARGMAAALPYVDEFVDGHSLASLAHLAHVLDGRHERAARLGAR